MNKIFTGSYSAAALVVSKNRSTLFLALTGAAMSVSACSSMQSAVEGARDKAREVVEKNKAIQDQQYSTSPSPAQAIMPGSVYDPSVINSTTMPYAVSPVIGSPNYCAYCVVAGNVDILKSGSWFVKGTVGGGARLGGIFGNRTTGAAAIRVGTTLGAPPAAITQTSEQKEPPHSVGREPGTSVFVEDGPGLHKPTNISGPLPVPEGPEVAGPTRNMLVAPQGDAVVATKDLK